MLSYYTLWQVLFSSLLLLYYFITGFIQFVIILFYYRFYFSSLLLLYYFITGFIQFVIKLFYYRIYSVCCPGCGGLVPAAAGRLSANGAAAVHGLAYSLNKPHLLPKTPPHLQQLLHLQLRQVKFRSFVFIFFITNIFHFFFIFFSYFFIFVWNY